MIDRGRSAPASQTRPWAMTPWDSCPNPATLRQSSGPVRSL